MNILRKPWQFRVVYRNGKKINCKHTVVFYRDTSDGDEGLQVGVVASKRVGNAVKRSRAKRLLREGIRTTIDRFKNKDMWVVLVAKSSILDCKKQDLQEDLEYCLTNEGLIQ